MENIEKIKQELLDFAKRQYAYKEILDSIKGNTLTELVGNISLYINWFKDDYRKEMAFNSIFNNDLVIENRVLLCNCSNEKNN